MWKRFIFEARDNGDEISRAEPAQKIAIRMSYKQEGKVWIAADRTQLQLSNAAG